MPNLKPVQKIELSEKHMGPRIAIVILSLVIGAVAFAYGIKALFTTEAGWQAISADSRAEANCSNEFVLLYNVGKNVSSAAAENKAIKALYTDVSVNAYRLFHNKQEFENVRNVYYINQHPNEEIVVDEVLYEAFALLQSYGNRNLYLAPVYTRYDDIFYCNDDSELVNFDPYLNPQVAADYKKIAEYAKDPDAVHIQLLGDNKIKLYVSDAYLKYAQENLIEVFIDFFWMKNAFIADYMADTLIARGYTAGCISSYDGFIRNLDASETSYSFNIYDQIGQSTKHLATMEYTGPKSIVYLRNYPMNSSDERYYYELDNGDIRTAYLDVQDGLCKSARSNLCSYSKDKSCAEILLQMIPIYIADDFQEEKLGTLVDVGIYSIYFKENELCSNDDTLKLTKYP